MNKNDELQRQISIANKQLQALQPLIHSANTKPIETISLNSLHSAKYCYEFIMKEIREFEANLDNDHEVCLRLASFGQGVKLSVTTISYHNPSTIIFYGYVENQPATLIQNVNQLNFLLLAGKRKSSDDQRKPIGFSAPIED